MPSYSLNNEVKESFDQYYLILVEFACYMVKDEEYAKDIVQDVFVKLLERNQALPKDPRSIKSYLYTMVRNASLNKIRSNQTSIKYTNYLKNNPEEQETVLDALIYSESINELYKAIDSLPSACKEVCTLTYLQEESNINAAELTNTSINTIKTQKRRALKHLRQKLAPAMNIVKSLFL